MQVKRREVISRIQGGDPTKLFRMFRGSSDPYYLNLLVEYNEDDVMSLKPLAELVVRKLRDNFLKK